MTNDVLGYSQAAAFLGIPIGTLYAWVSQGRVPHYRFSKRMVRFSRQEIETWISARHVEIVTQNSVAKKSHV